MCVCRNFLSIIEKIRATRKQNNVEICSQQLTLCEYADSLPDYFVCVWGGVALFINVLCCPIMCHYALSSCRYDFHIKTMFISSLPPVFCRRAHVLFTLFLLACV